MISLSTRRARRNGFLNASEETLSHDLSKKFGELLGNYIPPDGFTFNAARGYWAHNHQEVQRIAGHFRAGDITYSFGSWDYTPSALAKAGCHIIDERGNKLSYNDFTLEKGPKPKEQDDNDYSLVQLEEISWKKSQGLL